MTSSKSSEISPNVILINKDDYRIELRSDHYSHVKLVNRLVCDLGLGEDEKPVEIPIGIQVDALTMDKIKEFLELLVKHGKTEDEVQKTPVPGEEASGLPDIATPTCFMKKWEEGFSDLLDEDLLYSLMVSANYLEIQELLELCISVVANMIRGRPAEEVRNILGIECDLTEEELERIHKENVWLAD